MDDEPLAGIGQIISPEQLLRDSFSGWLRLLDVPLHQLRRKRQLNVRGGLWDQSGTLLTLEGLGAVGRVVAVIPFRLLLWAVIELGSLRLKHGARKISRVLVAGHRAKVRIVVHLLEDTRETRLALCLPLVQAVELGAELDQFALVNALVFFVILQFLVDCIVIFITHLVLALLVAPLNYRVVLKSF